MEFPIIRLKLKRYEKTFSDLSKKDFYELKKSIERWGIIEPIDINQNNVIICGKERYLAALLLGIEKIPVVVRKTNGYGEIRDISQEENVRRRHLPPSEEGKETETVCALKGGRRGRAGRRRNGNCSNASNVGPTRWDSADRREVRYRINTKLIPELSKMLDEGKINQEAASLYEKLSFENQKKIYGFLVDKFSNDKFMKREDYLKVIGERDKDENKKR